jgi:hypothetical protein
MCITTVLCFEQSAGSNDYITSNWKRIQHLLPPEQGMLSITQVQIDASAAYASAAILSFIEAFLCFVQAGIAIGLRLARNPLAPPPPPPLLSESKDKKQLEQVGSIMKDIQARNGKGKSKSMEALQEATQKVQDMVLDILDTESATERPVTEDYHALGSLYNDDDQGGFYLYGKRLPACLDMARQYRRMRTANMSTKACVLGAFLIIVVGIVLTVSLVAYALTLETYCAKLSDQWETYTFNEKFVGVADKHVLKVSVKNQYPWGKTTVLYNGDPTNNNITISVEAGARHASTVLPALLADAIKYDTKTQILNITLNPVDLESDLAASQRTLFGTSYDVGCQVGAITITLPYSLFAESLDVTTSSTGVNVSFPSDLVQGFYRYSAVTLQTTTGFILADGVTCLGFMSVKSNSGPVHVRNVLPAAGLNVTTSNDIVALNVTALSEITTTYGAVNLMTSGTGRVILSNLFAASQMNIVAEEGYITGISAALLLQETVSLQTTSGDIYLSFFVVGTGNAILTKTDSGSLKGSAVTAKAVKAYTNSGSIAFYEVFVGAGTSLLGSNKPSTNDVQGTFCDYHSAYQGADKNWCRTSDKILTHSTDVESQRKMLHSFFGMSDLSKEPVNNELTSFDKVLHDNATFIIQSNTGDATVEGISGLGTNSKSLNVSVVTTSGDAKIEVNAGGFIGSYKVHTEVGTSVISIYNVQKYEEAGVVGYGGAGRLSIVSDSGDLELDVAAEP